jgi:hypothetical protein
MRMVRTSMTGSTRLGTSRLGNGKTMTAVTGVARTAAAIGKVLPNLVAGIAARLRHHRRQSLELWILLDVIHGQGVKAEAELLLLLGVTGTALTRANLALLRENGAVIVTMAIGAANAFGSMSALSPGRYEIRVGLGVAI